MNAQAERLIMGNIDKRIKPEEMIPSTNTGYTTLVTKDMIFILSGDAVIRIPASWYQPEHSTKRTFFSRKSDSDAIKQIAQSDLGEETPDN